MEVDRDDDVTVGGKQLGVPAIRPVVAPRALRAAVDQELHGILLVGVESRRRIRKPWTFSFAAPVNQNDSIGCMATCDSTSSFIWVSGLAFDSRQSGTEYAFGRKGHAALREHQRRGVDLVGRRDRHACRRPASCRRESVWDCRCSRPPAPRGQGLVCAMSQSVDRVLAFVAGGEVNGLRIGRPRDRVNPAIEVRREVGDLAGRALVQHQAEAVALVAAA